MARRIVLRGPVAQLDPAQSLPFPCGNHFFKEKKWADIQSIDDDDDGSLTLTMTTSGYRDVKRWVMSFGKEAVLLEPEEMLKEIEAELTAMLDGIKGMKKS